MASSPPRHGSLSRLLFGLTITVSILPALLLAGWLLYDTGSEGSPNDPEQSRALANAFAFSNALERWLTRTESQLRAWGEIPAVVEGVRLAAVEHHELGYTEQTPEEVNAQLVHKRHLGLAPQADEYLAGQVARSDAWSQVHYSDEYGFTVGVAGLEEDFVQTDEPWWQAAWARGRYEGRIAFDENVGGYGLRLALRIDDPATGAAVGVIDGVIPLSAIQEFADTFTREGSSGIRLLNDSGQLVVETQSGHARDRIMRLSAEAISAEGWREGVGSSGHSGGSREGGVERGWVRLAGSEGPHRDWIAIVERRAEASGARTLDWIAAVVVLIIALLIGLGAAAWQRQRIVPRLRRIARHAARLREGDVSEPVSDEGNDEIGQMALNLEQLRGTIRRALQIIGRQRREQQTAP